MICPPLVSSRRDYGKEHLRLVRMTIALKEKGLSIQQIKPIMDWLRDSKSGNFAVCTLGDDHESCKAEVFRTKRDFISSALSATSPVVLVAVP